MTKALRSKILQSKALSAVAVVFVVCLSEIPASAQNFTTLHAFDLTDGAGQSGMVEDTDGDFYGVTEFGGINNYGVYFKITPEGVFTKFYDFCDPGCGLAPMAAPVRGIDGILYGTTDSGGSPGCVGTVFKATTQGALSTLYSFCQPSSGMLPQASLVQAQDGNFYGTTYSGGAFGSGSVFKITPQGQLTTVYSFCSQVACADGSNPSQPGMLLGADGNLYGTTTEGGRAGTVFRLTLGGQLTTLYTFCSQSKCTDGKWPIGLVLANNGTLYGTTYEGGSEEPCNFVFYTGCGTIFQITPAGKFRTLHNFCQREGCPDGMFPTSLAIGSDGNLYGSAQGGGISENSGGTLFRIAPNGAFTILYTFCTQVHCPDGAWPGNLLQSTDGKFLGMTESDNGESSLAPGTIFRADLGLPPFVKNLPRFGKVGAPVIVFGSNLSGVTSVSFNGTSAAFTVLSKHQIKTTVPAGATTGTITVVTDHGTLASNLLFTVVP